MPSEIDGNQIRKVLLEIIDEYAKSGKHFTSSSVLAEVGIS